MLSFTCIGAQKAGTSWLFHQLSQHPMVKFPHGKEIHYWDWIQAGKRGINHTWYQDLFAPYSDLCCGDITPDYAILHEHQIRAFHALYPQLRILFILRNPLQRAWSAARMVMDVGGLKYEEVGATWLEAIALSRASQARGDYESTLRRWRSVFGADAVCVLLYDELQAAPRQFLNNVASHIHIDPDQFPTCSDQQLSLRVWSSSAVDMPDTTRMQLAKIYRGKIESLGEYLDMDLSDWLVSCEP